MIIASVRTSLENYRDFTLRSCGCWPNSLHKATIIISNAGPWSSQGKWPGCKTGRARTDWNSQIQTGGSEHSLKQDVSAPIASDLGQVGTKVICLGGNLSESFSLLLSLLLSLSFSLPPTFSPSLIHGLGVKEAEEDWGEGEVVLVQSQPTSARRANRLSMWATDGCCFTYALQIIHEILFLWPIITGK